MHQVQQPRPTTTPKQIFCSLTGVTETSKAEKVWASGLIYATMRNFAGTDPEVKFRRPEHGIAMTLGGASDWTRVKVSGSPPYEGRYRLGRVSYLPPECEGYVWHRKFNLDRLYLLIKPSFLRSCEFGTDRLDIPFFYNGHDRLLESVLWSLAREMRDRAQPLESVYVEHAAAFLMAHLMHAAKPDRRPQPYAGLSEATLRRVIEFMEEHLDQAISLAALAALTGTGVDVFARNFKACMGVPPYRYFLERRMHRAKALLAASDKSIAEIALEVGFSSQTHFTTQFSKLVNISPAAYRLFHRS
jgi:AraC family transcriptional regulator